MRRFGAGRLDAGPPTRAAPLLAGLLVLGGCTPGRPPWEQVSAHWQTVSSEHFVLHTDARARDNEDLLERLEDVHAQLAGTLFQWATIPSVEVLLLPNEDYQALLGGDSGGVFNRTVGKSGGLLVIKGSSNRNWLDQVAAHELVHRLVATQFPLMPVWLNEGIASYLETIATRRDKVVIGLVLPRPSGPIVALRSLAHARRREFHGSARSSNYHSARTFVHWMLPAAMVEELVQCFAI